MIYQELCEWITTLSYWQQQAAEQILSGKVFEEKDYCDIFKIFKKEMELVEDKMVCNPINLPTNIEESDMKSELVWNGVQNVKGINALKSGEGLDVSNTLTLVYGENGSGKSGYTRLFNNAFISKGDKSLIHNIFEEKHEDEHASFKFTKDGNNLTLEYPEEKDSEEFRRIMVFDTASAMQDMKAESELSFVPSEFSFFDTFLNVCDEIQKRLETEIQTRNTKNTFNVFFEKENEIKMAVEKLDHNTIIEVLQQYALSEDEKGKMEQVKKEKAKLVSLNLKDKIGKLNSVKVETEKMEKSVKEINKSFSEEVMLQLSDLIENLCSAEALSSSEGIVQFKNMPIENVGSKEWKEFLISAQRYYASIGHEVKNCIFCGQSIEEIELIDKYWVYLNSMAEKNYHCLENSVKEKIELYNKINLNPLEQTSIYGEWLSSNCGAIYEQLNIELSKIIELRRKVISALIVREWDNGIVAENIDLTLFAEVLKIVQNKISELDSEEIEKQIREMDEREQLFKDRMKLIQLLPQIKTFILNKKWVVDAEKKKVKTRNITSKQKELFSKYVTNDYIEIFNEECEKLNADFKAEIIQRGSKGVTLKKISIQGMMPGNILSDGEQRAICIANFLAEVKMNPYNIGVIFDDPVSSLDHKRRQNIAQRLVAEALERQITIFTHDITFLMEIKTLCEKQNIEIEMQTIRKISNQPGNISKIIPWQGMNVNGRIKKLNADLQELQKMEKDGLMDEYFYRVKAWCELLRESWERSVEEILLNDAVQRYNPCVQTQRLAKAPFTTSLYNEVEQGMTECSSWVHDRARALNADAPKASELKSYIDTFSNFVKNNRPK